MVTARMVVVAVAMALAVWCALPSRRPPVARRALDPRLVDLLRPRGSAPGPKVRSAAAAVAGLSVLLFLPGWAGGIVGAAVAAASFVGLGRLDAGAARRHRRAAVLDLPETLDLLAAALEAGLPGRLAVLEVSELGPPSTRAALAGVAARVSVGMGDAEAWRALADDPDWRVVAADLARSSETGSAAAQVLRQHAADARGRRHDELLKRARAVGVRSTLPLMACFLPAFLLVGVVPVVAGLVGQLFPR